MSFNSLRKSDGWKRFHSKSYDEYGILLWEKDGGNHKVTVSKYDFGGEGYQIQVSDLEEAKNGYPHCKVGIKKSEALRLAKAYMRSH